MKRDLEQETGLAAEYVVGFTGTREGMTEAQKVAVDRLLSDPRVTHVVHGDCVGADAECHKLARDNDLQVLICPPTQDRYRAFCQGDYMNPPLGYLTRNQVIVKSSDYMIAAPKEMTEQERGGTWYTVRFARKKGRKVVIVWPDGSARIDGTLPDHPSGSDADSVDLDAGPGGRAGDHSDGLEAP